jgi:hypothetical protein
VAISAADELRPLRAEIQLRAGVWAHLSDFAVALAEDFIAIAGGLPIVSHLQTARASA